MRFVLNTRRDDAATRICIDGLGERLRGHGVDAAVGDWDDYSRYDVAIFMGYDDDAKRARSQNPAIRVVLADPKQSRAEWIDAAREADALLVSSIEQRDAFLRLNANVFVYFMFPPMRAVERKHENREPFVIAYHGNRAHLEAMVDTVKPALEELGRRRAVELWALYNVEAVGKAVLGVPDKRYVRVRHIQWTADREPGTQVSPRFYDTLAQADIGVVPNQLPIRGRDDALLATAYPEGEFAYEPFDHLTRYKASTNPGRLYPFAQLGIPVISDFVPSAAQFIVDGESGFLASSPNGWFTALETLAASPELRDRMAAGLRRRTDAAYEAQIPALLSFLNVHEPRRPPSLGARASAENELGLLANYHRPAGPRGLRISLVRLRTRLRL